MQKNSHLLTIFCSLCLFFAAPVASATIGDCWRYLTGKAQLTPIREQGIAKKGLSDEQVAREWIWRENERKEAYAAGLNIAAPEMTDFIISIKNWRDLNNNEMRSILRVHNAFSVREFLEDAETPFAEILRQVNATDEDVALWKLRVPEKPIPSN